jgi:phosphoserine phosphatase
MHQPLPYGRGKVEAGRCAMGPARWLASCGDSLFDLDMMRVACLAVGVRPKPELRQALGELTRAVVLDTAR